MDLPRSRPPDVGWFQEVGGRMRRWWLAKMLGTTGGMFVFFIVYFWLLRHPQFPVTIMPLTGIDRLIPFWPVTLLLYLSLWFYVSLAPALILERRELLSFGLAAVVLSAVGLGIFFFWPTAVPLPDVDWSRYPSFGFLKASDTPGNACPSLHVAFAVFSGCWFERLLREMNAGHTIRLLNWLWCAGILYSTVAIRQHVVLDVLAGVLLGAVVAIGNFRWLLRTKRLSMT